LVHESQEEAFLAALKDRLSTFYGANSEKIQKSPDFARIISDKHFERLKNMYDRTLQEGGKLSFGGGFDARERYISPTILRGISTKMSVMKEEIFGPILPVLTYREVDDAVRLIREFETPLALYLFSEDSSATEKLLTDLPSGGVCVNNTVVHLAHPELPFGGQGASGMGNYHGEYGFRAFSHERAVLHQGALNATSFMTPPYQEKVKKMIEATLKWLT
jgi:aldehyde dehydrogenase (NAD+)